MNEIYIDEMEFEFYYCQDIEDFDICKEYDGVYAIHQAYNGVVVGRFDTKETAQIVLDTIRKAYELVTEAMEKDLEIDLQVFTYDFVRKLATVYECEAK